MVDREAHNERRENNKKAFAVLGILVGVLAIAFGVLGMNNTEPDGQQASLPTVEEMNDYFIEAARNAGPDTYFAELNEEFNLPSTRREEMLAVGRQICSIESGNEYAIKDRTISMIAPHIANIPSRTSINLEETRGERIRHDAITVVSTTMTHWCPAIGYPVQQW